MRYFYSDSTTALYMARNFGIRINATYDWNESRAWIEHVTEDKIYIHPDSKKILEPQPGDIYYTDTLHLGTIPESGCSEDLKTVYGFEIIYRDGKPFFWPEIEEDENE